MVRMFLIVVLLGQLYELSNAAPSEFHEQPLRESFWQPGQSSVEPVVQPSHWQPPHWQPMGESVGQSAQWPVEIDEEMMQLPVKFEKPEAQWLVESFEQTAHCLVESFEQTTQRLVESYVQTAAHGPVQFDEQRAQWAKWLVEFYMKMAGQWLVQSFVETAAQLQVESSKLKEQVESLVGQAGLRVQSFVQTVQWPAHFDEQTAQKQVESFEFELFELKEQFELFKLDAKKAVQSFVQTAQWPGHFDEQTVKLNADAVVQSYKQKAQWLIVSNVQTAANGPFQYLVESFELDANAVVHFFVETVQWPTQLDEKMAQELARSFLQNEQALVQSLVQTVQSPAQFDDQTIERLAEWFVLKAEALVQSCVQRAQSLAEDGPDQEQVKSFVQEAKALVQSFELTAQSLVESNVQAAARTLIQFDEPTAQWEPLVEFGEQPPHSLAELEEQTAISDRQSTNGDFSTSKLGGEATSSTHRWCSSVGECGRRAAFGSDSFTVESSEKALGGATNSKRRRRHTSIISEVPTSMHVGGSSK